MSSTRAAHAAVLESLERELHQRHGLTVSEFEVLQRLAESPEQHSQDAGACGTRFTLSQSALSRLIGRLETDGFVSRSLSDSDRRGIFACLTPEGRELVEQAVPTQAEVLAATLAR